MPTPGERKALLFLGAVLTLGGGVRVARAVGSDTRSDPSTKAAIERQIEAVDSVRKHGRKKKARNAARTASGQPNVRRGGGASIFGTLAATCRINET